jgi:hypothetical protein
MPRIRLVPGGQTTTLSATSAWNVEASTDTTKYIEWDDVKVLLDADKQYGCSLYEAGGAQSIPDATWTAVEYDSEHFDHGGYHSVGSNTERITVPTGQKGLYIFGGVLGWTTGATGNRQGRISKNGSTVLTNNGFGEDALDDVLQNRIVLIGIDVLDVADYITMDAYQNSGSAQDTGYQACRFFAYMMTRVP